MAGYDTIKIIVLDFDNCLILNEETGEGSEEIKDRAWFDVFSEYEPDVLAPILDEEKLKVIGGKGDRKDIVEQILKRFEYSESEISDEAIRRCDRFNAIIQDGIKRINVSPATRESLAALSIRFPLYINTATPQGAVLESLRFLDITSFFKSVYGRPGTKISNLQDIIIAESVSPEKILFVDDQQSGYETAKEIGCQFIGIHTKRNRLWNDNPQPFLIINSLSELPKIV